MEDSFLVFETPVWMQEISVSIPMLIFDSACEELTVWWCFSVVSIELTCLFDNLFLQKHIKLQ